MRPPSIVRFEQLYILKIIVGIAVGLWTMSTVFAALAPPTVSPDMAAWLTYIPIVSILVQVAISLLLLYFIARRGSDIAKWIFVVLLVIGIAGTMRAYLRPHPVVLLPSVLKVAGLVELLIELAMLFLLFRPDAKAWFVEKRRLRR